MTIASDLLHRHFQTLVADSAQWQTLIADDLVWELRFAPAIGHPGRLSGRAEVVRAEGGRIDVRGEGPGLLVVAQSWDPGWSASLDGAAAPILRVDHAQLGIVLPAGPHRVALRYRTRGLLAGTWLAVAAAAGLALRGRRS